MSLPLITLLASTLDKPADHFCARWNIPLFTAHVVQKVKQALGNPDRDLLVLHASQVAQAKQIHKQRIACLTWDACDAIC